jgi:hypothetical protein
MLPKNRYGTLKTIAAPSLHTVYSRSLPPARTFFQKIFGTSNAENRVKAGSTQAPVLIVQIKVAIGLSKNSVNFFKKDAKKHRTQYQKMIRRLLDICVAHHQDAQQADVKSSATYQGSTRRHKYRNPKSPMDTLGMSLAA